MAQTSLSSQVRKYLVVVVVVIVVVFQGKEISCILVQKFLDYLGRQQIYTALNVRGNL